MNVISKLLNYKLKKTNWMKQQYKTNNLNNNLTKKNSNINHKSNNMFNYNKNMDNQYNKLTCYKLIYHLKMEKLNN